eukprot:TRINITY_DN35657_c0_g1_i1.p1 TRINITY_DN35657_c0_g1~~TRINITY_DN35657_c0_g1_i1.p1  ORF type:complete len:1559 (+),score=320.88 TRINITY_DN35657_c0_g1_i1:569-5245(+)
MTSLVLKAFRPSSHKVYHLDLHPTQAWLVTSDGGDNVVVWDWEHRQVLYELNAAGVDERRVVDKQLERLAEGEADARGRGDAGAEAIRGGGVKDVKFFDDDVRFWTHWLARSTAEEAPTLSATAAATLHAQVAPYGSSVGALRGRRLLVMCCEYKAIILDLVTMRARDVTKAQLENRTPLCVDFLPRSAGGDGPFAAIGGPDGVIRVLSLATLEVARKHVGGHKGAVHCLLTFMAANGEILLVSGGSDGALIMWSAESSGSAATKELGPKISIAKGHDSGVIDIALARVVGGPPQLVTCGADKTVAVWDSLQCRELRRMKAVPKMTVNAVASWRHPRASAIDILATVKDSHVWAIDQVGNSRPLVDLSFQMPQTPQFLAGKKLKMYCMAVHPLQPHLIAFGTNMGAVLATYAPTCIPPAVALPATPGEREQTVVCQSSKSLFALSFQVATQSLVASSSIGHGSERVAAGLASVEGGVGRNRMDTSEASSPQVQQKRNRLTSTPVDTGFAQLGVSKSGKYVSAHWPDHAQYVIYRTSDWGLVDQGTARNLVWDTCQDRFAVIGAQRPPPGSVALDRASSFRSSLRSSKKKEQIAIDLAHAAAMAADAAAASSAPVEIRRISESEIVVTLCPALKGKPQPVVDLQGGALLGVAYRIGKKFAPAGVPGSTAAAAAASAVSAAQGAGSISALAPGGPPLDSGANFLLFSWDTFQPISPLLPQPEWTSWDPAVEHVALAYPSYIVIAALRPQFRYLGNVAIEAATGGVWHRRQLFLATPTTIECLFVDGGVSEVDLNRKRQLAEQAANEAVAKAVAEKGELAVLTLDTPKVAKVELEHVQLRPPMLQVVRLASFQTAPAVPPISAITKARSSMETESAAASLASVTANGSQSGSGLPLAGLLDGPPEARAPEVVVGGGGVSVATTRLPVEQRRPVGPLMVVGVRDGVLWLVDSHMTSHAIGLSHPGIRCRCLAAYGDPVSAVKWASRLGREHHDDMAQFLVGMGYAREALHLPGLSKRFEFELATQVGELQRALSCLNSLAAASSSALASTGPAADVDAPNDGVSNPLLLLPDSGGSVLALAATQARTMEQVAGVARYAAEYLDLIDTADATAHSDIASSALRRLAAAGAVEGALPPQQLRALAIRLATHGETARLQTLSVALVKGAEGHEAALAAALLGDATLLEKAWQATGMLPQAALHAQSHGRPTLQPLAQEWNLLLRKDQLTPSGTAASATTPNPASSLPASFGSLFPLAGAPPLSGPQKPPANSPLPKLANVGGGVLKPLPKQSFVEVIPPKPFEPSAAETASLQAAAAARGGGVQSLPPSLLHLGGGVQGRNQPLDLALLDGTGPAPQKGPAVIAVPLDFSVLERKADTAAKIRAAEMAQASKTADWSAPYEPPTVAVAATRLVAQQAQVFPFAGENGGFAAFDGTLNGAGARQIPESVSSNSSFGRRTPGRSPSREGMSPSMMTAATGPAARSGSREGSIGDGAAAGGGGVRGRESRAESGSSGSSAAETEKAAQQQGGASTSSPAAAQATTPSGKPAKGLRGGAFKMFRRAAKS